MIGQKPRRWVPEVIQSSAADCGPAALRAALLGFGIEVSYERLREACRVNVDGSSMEQLAQLAEQLGLQVDQVWLPLDHLVLPDTPFPALSVIQLPSGLLHFILVWNQVGPLYQVMDPASGRRWITAAQLLGMSYEHQLEVPADEWRQWAEGPEFARALAARLDGLRGAPELLKRAYADKSPVSLAGLDAALRMVEALVQAGGLKRGPETRVLLASLFDKTVTEWKNGQGAVTVPASFYSALPTADGKVQLNGPVLLRFRGRSQARSTSGVEPLADEVLAELTAPEPSPWRRAYQVLAQEGPRLPLLVLAALTLSATLGGVEALLFRTLIDLGLRLGLGTQRLSAGLLLLLFLGASLALELWTTQSVRALGRRFELRLRAALLAKIPRLEDSYFQSRLASDLAHRSHIFHGARETAPFLARIFRLHLDLLIAAGLLIWLAPATWWLTLLATFACVAVPLLGRTLLTESEYQVRAYGGTLAQNCLDALLGAAPIRAHGAERAVRWEQGGIVLEWARAARERLRILVSTELLQSALTVGLSIFLVRHYLAGGAELGGSLLYMYFALSLPALGQEQAVLSRALPRHRNLLVRLLEPLDSTQVLPEPAPLATSAAPGAALRLHGVTVKALGQVVLDQVDLEVAAGEHIAVVGPSGAGKSSLLGVLLGWLKPEHGSIFLDGQALDRAQAQSLRQSIAWIDPAVTLWNASLLDNLKYGAADTNLPIDQLLEQAELIEVLERLPEGLQTGLGESGRLLSGGEGQRVRIARAMAKSQARLVLLDEPFRGIEREGRRRLLQRCRQLWAGRTLLCVTHDLSHTLSFDRVVVVEGGRIIEQGPPKELAARSGSRYYELLRAEELVHRQLWNDPSWRRIRLEQGSVREDRRKAVGE